MLESEALGAVAHGDDSGVGLVLLAAVGVLSEFEHQFRGNIVDGVEGDETEEGVITTVILHNLSISVQPETTETLAFSGVLALLHAFRVGAGKGDSAVECGSFLVGP